MKRIWIKRLAGVLAAAVIVCSMPLFGMAGGGPASYAESGGRYNLEEGTVFEEPADPSEDIVLHAQRQAKLAEKENVEFEGYLFRVEETAEIPEEGALPEGVEEVPYTDNTFEAESLDQILEMVPEDNIETIEPNYTVYLQDADAVMEPRNDDPYYLSGAQWNLETIGAESAWQAGLEGQDRDAAVDMDYDGAADNDDIVVAVIDSGVNAEHEEFDEDRVLEGKTFISGTEDAGDALGHGTFIAGIIAGERDNARGIAGLAEHVKILPLRVFNRGTSSLTNVISAINYALTQKQTFDQTHGAEGVNVSVINMSLGFSRSSSELKAAVNNCIDAGMIVVCSAGNAGNTTANYPAQYAIGIGSIDPEGTVSNFSQRLSEGNGDGYENKVWTVAPGKNMIGPYYYSSSAYITDSGTSFATPQATALAAVCKSIDNGFTHSQFRQLLKDSAVSQTGSSGDIGGQDVEYGWGVLDYEKAIDTLLAEKEGTAEVTVSVRNVNGTALSDPSVHIFEIAEDGTAGAEVSAGAQGKYSLDLGEKYIYRASADGYEEQEGRILLLNGEDAVNITLRSGVFPTRIIVQDDRGYTAEHADIFLRDAEGKLLELSDNGTFPTVNGSYTYSVEVPGLPEAEGSFTLDDPSGAELQDGVNAIVVGVNGHVVKEAWCLEEGRAVIGGQEVTIPALEHSYDAGGICIRCGEEQVIPENDPVITIAGKQVTRTELQRISKTAYLFYWPNDYEYYDRRVEGVYLRDIAEHYGDGSRCIRRMPVSDGNGKTLNYPLEWFDETMLVWNIDGQDLPVDDSSNGFRMAVNDGNDGHWMESPTKISFSYQSHSYGAAQTVPATCGSEGYQTRTCTLCGHETHENVVPPTGEHSWDGGHALKDANGADSGVTVYYCTVCGESRCEGMPEKETVPMYRLYNPNSGEHFYTGSEDEKAYLVDAGWDYEGVAWNAPTESDTPVYRLYNENAGDHHYTAYVEERDALIEAGWRYEGVCWNSDDQRGTRLYRLYNPNAYDTGGAGAHHYTGSKEERDQLVELGWRDEGTAWYGA